MGVGGAPAGAAQGPFLVDRLLPLVHGVCELVRSLSEAGSNVPSFSSSARDDGRSPGLSRRETGTMFSLSV